MNEDKINSKKIAKAIEEFLKKEMPTLLQDLEYEVDSKPLNFSKVAQELKQEAGKVNLAGIMSDVMHDLEKKGLKLKESKLRKILESKISN